MHAPVLIVCLVLFGGMFLPLPSPVGLALSLWALAEGVPVAVVLTLYVAQDLITYAVLQRVLPRITQRFAVAVARWFGNAPAYVKRPLALIAGATGTGEAGLFCASLASFYAGAAVAAVRTGRPASSYRAGAIVIGTDVFKYSNGLAIALGASLLLPSSVITTAVASLGGLAIAPLYRLLSERRRHPMLIPVAHR